MSSKALVKSLLLRLEAQHKDGESVPSRAALQRLPPSLKKDDQRFDGRSSSSGDTLTADRKGPGLDFGPQSPAAGTHREAHLLGALYRRGASAGEAESRKPATTMGAASTGPKSADSHRRAGLRPVHGPHELGQGARRG